MINDAINQWDPTWFDLMPDAKNLELFKNYGYYSAPLARKDGTPLGDGKSKIIVLDSNICY